MDFISYISLLLLFYGCKWLLEYKIEYNKIFIDSYDEPMDQETEKIFKIVVPKNDSVIYSQEYRNHEYSPYHIHYVFRDI